MILTDNFFNVCRTAIEQTAWKGKDAKRVSYVLDELDKLYLANQEAREKQGYESESEQQPGETEIHTIENLA